MALTHVFNTQVAADYSVNQSIILTSLMWWYEKASAHKENVQSDGRVWVRMSATSLAKVKPYFNVRQIRIAIAQLVENGLLFEGEFNEKNNDRTKWYSPTSLAKNYFNISDEKEGYKNVTLEGYKNVTPCYKNVTSIYKEVDIVSRYNNIVIDKLQKNDSLIELLAMQQKLKKETVAAAAVEFAKHCESVNQKHQNDKDLFLHFGNWLRKQNLTDVNVDVEINWFIKMFNQVSNKQFKITDVLRERFARQLSFGFTGPQMVKAVQNLYSSNPKNKYHIDTSFKFATPEYLCKDDNVNKYLNVKL